MPTYQNPIDDDEKLTLAETDKPLAETLNPAFRYALFSQIAKGGKSTIQSCMDLYLGRKVCHKSLRREFASDDIEQRRLLREARIIARLQHPNIVPTYDLGRTRDGGYFFTMKLLEGYTLRELLDYRERYDLTQMINVIEQIANALAFAHQKGVLHRDIKPENILVGRFGEIVLLDWGLAKVWDHRAAEAGDSTPPSDNESGSANDGKFVSHMTQHGPVQGTISYMSPEQLDKEDSIDDRSDVYSLGAVLYEILCGQTVFEGERMDILAEKVRSEPPVAPSTKTSAKLPKMLEDLTMQCLQKDPDRRIGSMNDVLRVLSENWLMS